VPPLPHHRAYGSRTRRFDGVSLDTDMKSGPELGFGVLASPRLVRSLGSRRLGFHPGGAGCKASEYWVFCRIPLMSHQS
jgi:hypothetical protein